MFMAYTLTAFGPDCRSCGETRQDCVQGMQDGDRCCDYCMHSEKLPEKPKTVKS